MESLSTGLRPVISGEAAASAWRVCRRLLRRIRCEHPRLHQDLESDHLRRSAGGHIRENRPPAPGRDQTAGRGSAVKGDPKGRL